jgi:DNA excision repair protein ERCC-2
MSGTDPASQIEWLEPFFELAKFITISDLFDETYRVIVEPEGQSVTLLCLDPSKRLSETVAGLRSAVFFSATLSPLEYFVELLGGESTDAALTFDSPFEAKQMRITIAPHDVSYQGRENSLAAVTKAIFDHLKASPGTSGAISQLV